MAHGWVLGIAAIFLAGLVSPVAYRRLGDRWGVLAGLIPLAACVGFATLLPTVLAGQPARLDLPWVPSLGISLSFYADGLSLLFLLVISAIGTYIVWYAAGYLHGDPNLGRFYLYLFGFMGAMLGLVCADNIILLFIFWELTSITSYLLIGYYNEKEKSRAAALQALLVTGGGGLAMLAGLILLGFIGGSFEISTLIALPAGSLTGDPLFVPALILILLGAFTKSAQFPFHFWLPNAMEAPAPVSAFLHSATMVKAGVFLLARLHPALADHPLWTAIVTPVGAITMVIGILLGLGQRDLKKILAYTTLSVLGILTMLLGIGTRAALLGAMAFLLAHALYKAALFMTAGAIDHETGSRDPDALSGLRRKMPVTAAAALLATLSMAGIPLFFGFIGKEYVYTALVDPGSPGVLLTAVAVIASMGMTALAVIAGLRPFLGPLRETPKHPHEAPWTMWIGPIILGVIGIAFGLLPGLAGKLLVAPAAIAIAAEPDFRPYLSLWHGFNLPLLLSLVTLAGAVGIYLISGRFRAATGIYQTFANIGPERGYALLLAGMLKFSAWLTRALQNGYLRRYVLTIGGFTVLLLAIRLPGISFDLDVARMAPLSALGLGTCLLIAAGAVATCLAQTRFAAIIALGVVGLGIAILFFLFSAPDLAMTQILVEALTVVLFVLAFYKLPLMKHRSRVSTRVRDALFASAFGALMTVMVLIGFQIQPDFPLISEYMGRESYPIGQGRNVVNVILVDFRALDTLGEITVLAIGALGIFAMLKLRPGKKDDPQ